MVPLTPISELTPTTEQQFRRTKQLRKELPASPVKPERRNYEPSVPNGEPQQGSLRKKRSSIVASIHTGPVLQALAEANFSDQDIWEGTPKLFSVLSEFKDVLHLTGESTNIVSFLFPRTPDFGGLKAKTYKIKNNQPIKKLVASILKRVASKVVPARFGISTLGGYILDDKETLSSYGLGSLLESWELRIVEKKAVPKRAIPPPPKTALPPLLNKGSGFAEDVNKGSRLQNSKKLERRVQNSEMQQGELEGKMTALALRLEQQLEERDRKINELVNNLKEKEATG